MSRDIQRYRVGFCTVNLALLLSHEIDSAYWKEWEMFRIPGGIQVFVLLNLFLILLALLGLIAIVSGHRHSRTFSFLIAGASALTFGLHSAFLALGYSQFCVPVSLSIIVALLLASLGQVAFEMRHRNA